MDLKTQKRLGTESLELKKKINKDAQSFTPKEKKALKDIWSAFKKWDDEMTEMDGDCLYSTVHNLRKMRSNFLKNFPAIVEEEYND